MKKCTMLWILLMISALLLTGCGRERGDASPSNAAVPSASAKTEETKEVPQAVLVDGALYYSTGQESTVTGRCGVMDGEITSSVAAGQLPTEENQSNFGTGDAYQYGTEGTLEVQRDGVWMVFSSAVPEEDPPAD